MLSLNNFADLLDPDLIEQAKMASDRNEIPKPKEEGPGFFSINFPDENHCEVELNTRGRVELCTCTCPDFDQANWQEDLCYHLIALLTALKVGPEASVAKSKARKTAPKKEPAKSKDPAENLLLELDPTEVVEFLRQQLRKNKALKSIFLTFFSDRNPDPKQFDEIIHQALAEVKGRRRSLQPADAAKLASLLQPLCQQGAKAEAEGLFRLAFHISLTLLKQLSPIFEILTGNSKQFIRLFDNVIQLLEQLFNNSNTPYEFREESFREFFAVYFKIVEQVDAEQHSALFNLLEKAAKQAQAENELKTTFIAKLDALPQPYSPSYLWTSDYVVRINLLTTVVQLLFHNPKDADLLISVLEKNKFIGFGFFLLVELYLGKKQPENARKILDEYKKKPSSIIDKRSDWNFEQKINHLTLQVTLLEENYAEAEALATTLFQQSGYSRIEYLAVLKKIVPENKWAEKVQFYLKKTVSIGLPIGSAFHPYFEILAFENISDKLLKELKKNHTPLTWWARYSVSFKENLTAEFINAVRERIIVDFPNIHPYSYPSIIKLLEGLHDLSGGPVAVKKLLEELELSNTTNSGFWQMVEESPILSSKN